MDFYPYILFLHIGFVILWLGGGFILVVKGIRADRVNDTEEFGRTIRDVMFFAERLFVPAGILAFLTGLAMAIILWSFTFLWIIIGIIGFAATFLTGLLILKPRADRIGALMSREGVSAEAMRQGRELLQIAKFDYVMLFVVVADMVLKPEITDVVTLLVMVAVIAAGAAFFLRPVFMAQPATR